MRKSVFIILMAMTLKSFGQDSILESIQLSTLIDSRTAFEIKSSALSKSEVMVRPELEVPFSKGLRLVALGRFYVELLDELEPGVPEQNEISKFSKRSFIGDFFELELREFYLDWKIKNHYLTIGKQQIVWGEADGLKILDVVNPINLREFLLDDFDQSRIPLWSVKAEIDLRKVTAQFIFIPDQTYHDIPDNGAPFFPMAFFPAPPEDQVSRPLEKPSHFLKDSDVGVRLSSFANGWDFSVNYLFVYDDFPVIDQAIDQGTLTAAPTYKRYHLLGATVNNSFGSFTLRNELGLSLNKSFNSFDLGNLNLSDNNQLAGVLGVDYYGISNTTISSQIFVDQIFGVQNLIGRESLEINGSLLINRNFLNQTLTAELVVVQNINIKVAGNRYL